MDGQSSTSRDDRNLVSIVVPVYNEADALPKLAVELLSALRTCGWRYEVLFINDGSRDDSDAILDQLAREHEGLKVLHLSRNFGQQAAVQAGIEHARGDAIVLMDADLQDDPHIFPQFLAKWKEGYDVVYAVRVRRKENWFRCALVFCFYRLLNQIAEVPLPLDAGNFGLIDRRVAQEIICLKDHDRYFPGLRGWVGFRQIGLPVERSARQAGEPKASFWDLLRLAKTALICFSTLPLMMFYALAGVSILVMIGLSGFALYHKFVTGFAIPGWTSYLITASFFGALNALGIAILGEYVLRIYNQVRGRPLYLIQRITSSESLNGSEQIPGEILAGLTRESSDAEDAAR